MLGMRGLEKVAKNSDGEGNGRNSTTPKRTGPPQTVTLHTRGEGKGRKGKILYWVRGANSV